MNESSPKKIASHARALTPNPVRYHATSLRIPFFEVDAGQAVYHGNYYHIFELAREDFLRKISFPYREFIKLQLHLTIVESRCKYRKPLRYDDEIEIHTGITSLGRRGISFSQSIYKRPENSPGSEIKDRSLELCTEMQINMVCIRFSGQPTLLPEEFLNALKHESEEAGNNEKL
jgi:acyl-CoA thioester hydrolase